MTTSTQRIYKLILSMAVLSIGLSISQSAAAQYRLYDKSLVFGMPVEWKVVKFATSEVVQDNKGDFGANIYFSNDGTAFIRTDPLTSEGPKGVIIPQNTNSVS